jgi:two-component system sensor histidine kinase HydH
VREGTLEVFRAFVPFHEAGKLRVARIDIDVASADFLLEHARHNVLIATISGAALVLLAGYALWALRRLAGEEKRHLEMAHLAHLGEMAAVLAHEIRTPLATIKGFTQLAIEKAGEGARPMLSPVITETQRLERLVTDLLLYGRPPQPVLVDCSWQEIAELLSDAAATVRIERAPLHFRADAGILRHVLTNLIRNAAEAVAADRNGWVRVSAEASDATVILAVEDNGPGIQGDAAEKVFDSFFTTKSFGTGLGLPIAKRLTESLGGNLKLKSRVGGGVRAEVRLPRVLTQEDAAEVSL